MGQLTKSIGKSACCSEQPLIYWKTFDRQNRLVTDEKRQVVNDDWHQERLRSSLASSLEQSRSWDDSDVAVILTSANSLRRCTSCKTSLEKHYGMPSFWWSSYCQNANGYFGSSAVTDQNGRTTRHTSWGKFRIKLIHGADEYSWYKINVFVHWTPNRTTIILFDTPASLGPKVPHALFQELSLLDLSDPFWVYGYLLGEVVRIQDEMIWAFRTRIRAMEKGRGLEGSPQPNFDRLHDLARHSVHFMEMLRLGTKTIGDILRDHTALNLMPEAAAEFAGQGLCVRDKLRFLENMLGNLHYRADSNHQRLHNEIQLTFNLVTQYDAKVSLHLSRAMQADGAATKTLTLLAAAFLPATFICALFSMSFFAYEPDFGWQVSDKIWIYFAFAVPITALTMGLWRYGPRIIPR